MKCLLRSSSLPYACIRIKEEQNREQSPVCSDCKKSNACSPDPIQSIHYERPIRRNTSDIPVNSTDRNLTGKNSLCFSCIVPFHQQLTEPVYAQSGSVIRICLIQDSDLLPPIRQDRLILIHQAGQIPRFQESVIISAERFQNTGSDAITISPFPRLEKNGCSLICQFLRKLIHVHIDTDSRYHVMSVRAHLR